MKKAAPVTIISLVSLLISCGSSQSSGGGRDAGVVEIGYNELCQEIDGFGASNAWLSLPHDRDLAEEMVKLFYSKTEGAGFTILRNRIPFRERLAEDDMPGYNDNFITRKADNTYDYTVNNDGTKTFNLNWNAWDLSNTRNLISRIKELGEDGPERLTIMSTPWTPPNNRVTQWKEDVVGVSGRLDYAIDWRRPDWWGRLKKDKYNDYADLLADYAKNFEAKMGAPLAILSIQNEPNWKVEYESAYWSGDDIRDFLKVIEQRFPAKGIQLGKDALASGGLGIMAPEYENFNVNFRVMVQPSLDDPKANRVLTHIGLHQYNAPHDSSSRAGSIPFPAIAEAGKRFWQTEVSGSGPNLPKGSGIDNALFYARMIHHDLTYAETNAFLYWWLWGSGGDDAGRLITVDGDVIEPAMRLYAMGQFSRFIRPGWVRIESTLSLSRGILTSAYRNPHTDEIAIVLINETPTAARVELNMMGVGFRELSCWRTSEKEKLKALGEQRFNQDRAKVELPPKSISTFYGRVL
jgi:O-glycosyl hydrolase